MDEPIRILCVDDEASVLKSIERVFLDEEYEILKATSGKEGLQILGEVSPVQIVMSDYRMPEMNGVDFLHEVRENWPETVRIVLSGYADTVAVVEAVNQGEIYKFLAKPWNDDELRCAIANALERYYLYQKNQQLTAELKVRNDELRLINENLEQMVEKRTEDLLLRNRVLTVSQNILQCLPVGVLGMDTEGMIVYCNEKGEVLFDEPAGNIMGKKRQSFFPETLNRFIQKVSECRCVSEALELENGLMRAKGTLVQHTDSQAGIVLVIDEEDSHG